RAARRTSAPSTRAPSSTSPSRSTSSRWSAGNRKAYPKSRLLIVSSSCANPSAVSVRCLLRLPLLRPPVGLQHLLSQSQRLRRHLHQLIVRNKLDRLLQR